MATGYSVSGRGDLDALFKPRTSAAGSNTGFRSNGGVDLAQRFEPRGSTTPIPVTGFLVGSIDLAQTFKDIAAAVGDRTMVAGQASGTTFGYRSTDYGTPFGSLSNRNVGGARVAQLISSSGGGVRFDLLQDGSEPADANSAWNTLAITGVFNDSAGATVTRTLTRSARSTTGAGVLGGITHYRFWTYPVGAADIADGIGYGLLFTIG